MGRARDFRGADKDDIKNGRPVHRAAICSRRVLG
jgi:hypothetical protein